MQARLSLFDMLLKASIYLEVKNLYNIGDLTSRGSIILAQIQLGIQLVKAGTDPLNAPGTVFSV